MRRITARFSVEWSFRGPAGILAELHVQPPMRGVLNRRMAAHGGGESVPFRERAQEIPTFRTGLIADEAGGLDPPDRLESGLVRSGVQPVDAVAQRVTADLDPAVVFLHGVLSRQAPADGFDIQPELHVFAQRGMDACRTHRDHSAKNLALIRRMALNVLHPALLKPRKTVWSHND